MSDPVVSAPVVSPPGTALPDLTLEELRAKVGHVMAWVGWAVALTPPSLGLKTIVGIINSVIADDDAARMALMLINSFRHRGFHSIQDAGAAIVEYITKELDFNPAPAPPKV